MMKTVWLTEFTTALLIVLAVYLPYLGLMVVLPLLGLALNGTSSVLYGAVPDLAGRASASRRSRFSIPAPSAAGRWRRCCSAAWGTSLASPSR